MLANPWKPVAARARHRGRHRSARPEADPRLLAGTTTLVLVSLVSTVVMPQQRTIALRAEAVLAAPQPSVVVTIPPTSVAPTTTPRPPLADHGIDMVGAEVMALAERTIVAEPQVARTEFVEFEPEPEAEIEVVTGAFETVELSVSALDLVGHNGRAVASEQALVVKPIPDDPFECHIRASELPLRNESGAYDRNLVAQMTHSLFECRAAVEGYNDLPPTSGGWDAAGVWGFENFSQQIAAEAVVVGYCESVAFAPSAIAGNNPWGYGGVFQMGDREMRMYGFRGASKFDPVDNVYSAATYFLSGVRRGHTWGGWGPWAVVNTNYNDEVNDRVKVPVLPRFTSTDPEWRGRRGVELPAWAVDPWSYEVPAFNGCPTTGRAWPSAVSIS